MKTQSNESRNRVRNAWGVGLFSAAAIALIVIVWGGYSPGNLPGALVLAGLVVGGGLVMWSFCEEEQPPAPLPAVTAPPSSAQANEVPPHLEKVLAEIAVLAWKIDKRAQKEPDLPKAIPRNVARILEILDEQNVEIVSYEGRRIFFGSDVNVLEAVEDAEEDKVVEQHEPEIQFNGKLLRRALLTVGKKRTAVSAPAASRTEPPTTNQPANPDSNKQP